MSNTVEKIRTIAEEVVRQGLVRMEECKVPLTEGPIGVYFLLVGLKIALLDPNLGTTIEQALMLNDSKEPEAMASVARLRKLVEIAQKQEGGNGNGQVRQ